MNYFRADNTEGFSEAQLNAMNADLEEIMHNYVEGSPDYEQMLKYEAEQIIESY